jgi:hypothetical protein
VIFAFTFDSQEGATAARSRLIAQGYRVELQPQEHGVVLAVWQSAEDDSAPEVVRARLESTVEPFGGESLGYGGIASYGLG